MVLTEQARESGKPEAVIEKMIVGRMKKFLGEVTLLGQDFVVNPDVTVAQAAKDAGVEITGYVRVAVGEGIEKKKKISPQKLQSSTRLIRHKRKWAVQSNAPPFLITQSGDEAGFNIKELAGRQNTRANQPPENRKECAELRN